MDHDPLRRGIAEFVGTFALIFIGAGSILTYGKLFGPVITQPTPAGIYSGLTLITIAEVAIYYIDSFESILVEALLIMSTVKFVTVVSYFMHLTFDDRRFAWTFGLAMIVALSIVIGFEVLFRFHRIDYAANFLTG